MLGLQLPSVDLSNLAPESERLMASTQSGSPQSLPLTEQHASIPIIYFLSLYQRPFLPSSPARRGRILVI